MSKLSLSQKKEIERVVTNSKSIKFRTSKEALNSKGQLKNGYHRLKNGKIVKLSDIAIKQLNISSPVPTPEQQAKDLGFDLKTALNNFSDDLKHLAIGQNKDGSLRKGFALTESGKVVSIKQLKQKVEESLYS